MTLVLHLWNFPLYRYKGKDPKPYYKRIFQTESCVDTVMSGVPYLCDRTFQKIPSWRWNQGPVLSACFECWATPVKGWKIHLKFPHTQWHYFISVTQKNYKPFLLNLNDPTSWSSMITCSNNLNSFVQYILQCWMKINQYTRIFHPPAHVVKWSKTPKQELEASIFFWLRPNNSVPRLSYNRHDLTLVSLWDYG